MAVRNGFRQGSDKDPAHLKDIAGAAAGIATDDGKDGSPRASARCRAPGGRAPVVDGQALAISPFTARRLDSRPFAPTI